MHDVLLIARREFEVRFFKNAPTSIAVTILLTIGGMFFITWLSKTPTPHRAPRHPLPQGSKLVRI
ncbi:hypothetical protein [Corynebacterium spheniscorum]|uniref:hypothetical protein n=1 Tax=Corynebacterium spheniscorum TaxID=185761 RepID=UPI000B8279E7|nr:hypothetical protein [Corynebacterium spheniscorum]KAA8719878.1 hypothetical protein F4V56_08945 [Corynebacterium spheniscorum]